MKKKIVQAMARGYCTDKNRRKILDPDLIDAMADEVMAVVNEQAEQIAELENRIEALTEDLGDADVENKRLKQHIKKICPDCEVRANRFVCHKDAGFDGVNSFCPDYCKAARRRKRVKNNGM